MWRSVVVRAVFAALSVSIGCTSSTPRAITVTTDQSSKNDRPVPPPGRLFAGHDGTCFIEVPGKVHCWGRVPERLEELARDKRASMLVFTAAHQPYCVADELGTVRCQQDCVHGAASFHTGPPAVVPGTSLVLGF